MSTKLTRQELEELVRQQQAQLNAQQRELDDAGILHDSIFPEELPFHPQWGFGAATEPYHRVGGDVYDIIELQRYKLAVVVGDIVDKGLRASMHLQAFRYLLHYFIENKSYYGPSTSVAGVLMDMRRLKHGASYDEILEKYQRQLAEGNQLADILVQLNTAMLNRLNMFLTDVIVELDLKTGEYISARSGHPPPIIQYANGMITEIPYGNGTPVGIQKAGFIVDVQQGILNPGDTMFMYTDGITEVPYGKGMLGTNGLIEIINQMPKLSAQDTANYLMKTINSYKPTDDRTVVVLRRL